MGITSLLVLCSLLGLCNGTGVLPDYLDGAVGGSVTFTTNLEPTDTHKAVFWMVNTSIPLNLNSSFIIGYLRYFPSISAPRYEGRTHLDTLTGSLELLNLTLADSGTYDLLIFPDKGARINGSTQLTVHEPVSNVVIDANGTDLVEFNSSVRLTCSSTGSSLSYLWLNGSSEVRVGEGVSSSSSSLTIVGVTRSDGGPFRCNVSNPVSSNTSLPLYLTINYGPENTAVEASPPGGTYATETDLTLSCSARSEPPARYLWFLNRTLLLTNEASAELLLENLQANQSGSYVCQAHNARTQRYESSQPSVVSVLAEGSPTQGLSVGAIAGIVIGVLLIVGGGTGAGVYFAQKKGSLLFRMVASPDLPLVVEI